MYKLLREFQNQEAGSFLGIEEVTDVLLKILGRLNSSTLLI